MKGAIEVLHNLRTICKSYKECVNCIFYDDCPAMFTPEKWTDGFISAIVSLPRYEEGNNESK